MQTNYHSGTCPGHIVALGEPMPPLSACRPFLDTLAEHERRGPRFNPAWREVVGGRPGAALTRCCHIPGFCGAPRLGLGLAGASCALWAVRARAGADA